MPRDISREQVALGTIAHQWIINEYAQYHRSRAWYITMISLGVALLAYALITGNNSFAVIIVLIGVVLYLHEQQKPLELNIALTDAGVVIGRHLYRYNEFESFWIVYEPGEVKSLYFMVNGLVKNRLSVPLGDVDPRPIKRYLGQFILENTQEEEEPFTDKLTRLFKIQ
jgi:hypothetical protein